MGFLWEVLESEGDDDVTFKVDVLGFKGLEGLTSLSGWRIREDEEESRVAVTMFLSSVAFHYKFVFILFLSNCSI